MERAGAERMRSLLQAVIAIAGDLDLQAVLHRIAEVAADLVDAEYAALGVISEDGRSLAQFLVVGVDDEMVARIGSLPAGHGVLGKLISDPQPLRLDNLADHADEIMKKVKKAKTDPEPLPSEEAGLAARPEALNLVTIYAASIFLTKLI